VRPGDVVIGLSTSGASPNVIAGLEVAKKKGAFAVMLSGASSKDCADLNIRVQSEDTPRIQEMHDFLLHMIAQNVESRLNSELSVGRFRDPFPFLLSDDDLPRFADWVEGSQTSLVSTNGVYDLLHGGHRKSLEQSRELGDQLVVLINSDASVRKIKKDGRPIRSESERVIDLQSLPFVSHVYIFDEDSPLEPLLKLRPSVHTKGSEYQAMDIPELALESRVGTKIVFIPRVDSRSTSEQISKIREGLVDS
jgi:rfaE bifunctional protein nucleotidyltransferase chain/domain